MSARLKTGIVWFIGALVATFAVHAVFGLLIFPENLFDLQIIGFDVLLAAVIAFARARRVK